MRINNKILFLCISSLLIIIFYLLWKLPENSLSTLLIKGKLEFVLELRLKVIFAIIITSLAIGSSTIVFHAIICNRIVTPQVLGLENLYELSNTIMMFVMGTAFFVNMKIWESYIINIIILISFFLILYSLFLKENNKNIFRLLLVGIICSTLFVSLTNFFQMLLDPDAFQIISYNNFASFNNVNYLTILLSFFVIIPIIIYFFINHRILDVLSLGRDYAISLGINYHRYCMLFMVLIAIALSAATALAGPMIFLGFLVLNITIQIMKTHYHYILIPSIIMVTIIIIFVGQISILHIFNFETTISVIINFVGGIYFFYVLLKENKKWQ